MKLVTNKFKSVGLHEKHVVVTWNLGNRLSSSSDSSMERLEEHRSKECEHASKVLSHLEWCCHHTRAISLISTRGPWRHLLCLDCSAVKLGVDKLRR